MPDSTRFDPIGWFFSACVTLLVGALALVLAVHLIQSVWLWIVGILGVVAAIGVAVTVWLAWQRRQPW